jgi:hypothetical protein
MKNTQNGLEMNKIWLMFACQPMLSGGHVYPSKWVGEKKWQWVYDDLNKNDMWWSQPFPLFYRGVGVHCFK